MPHEQFANQNTLQEHVPCYRLNAAICGTVSVCVLRFLIFGPIVSDSGLVTGVDSATLGSVFTIRQAGLYAVSLNYAATATGAINNLGITLNTDAAGLINDPGMATTGILDYASCLSPAGHNFSTKLSAVAVVTHALAGAANGAVIRFHAGNGANATPAAGDVTVNDVMAEISLLSYLV